MSDRMDSTSKRKKYDTNLTNLYARHGVLTDKKLLETITAEEERELERVRKVLDSHEQGTINFYEKKIKGYQGLLTEIEKIKESI